MSAAMKLEPCPCCGSADVAASNFDDSMPSGCDFIICNGCGLAVSRADAHDEPAAVWNRRTPPQGEVSALPEVLFDGNAVFDEITRKLGKSHCIHHTAVSATLDAVVRLMRAYGLLFRQSGDAADKRDAEPVQGVSDAEDSIDPLEQARRDGWCEGMQEAQGLLLAEIEDAARMDWLAMKVVNVRDPLRYGSRDMFWASPTQDDGDPYEPSDLRSQIDAARSAQTNGGG